MADWNLPTFDGDKDRTGARKMIDNVGGANSIRTKIIADSDGGETMLRTRNGFPEITTKIQKAAVPASALWHGIVVDIDSTVGSSSLFYTKGSVGGREKRFVGIQQQGVKNYTLAGIGNIYSLASGANYVWDLSKVSIASLPATATSFSYSHPTAKSGSEVNWSIPSLYSGAYSVVTPIRVIGSDGTQISSEISVPNIGSDEITAKATPPVIDNEGKAHLCAYKTKVISPTAGISQYNWSGLSIQQTGSVPIETSVSKSETVPILLDRTITADVGVGALSTYDPVVWYINVSHYPGGFIGSGSADGTAYSIGGGVETPSIPGIYANGGWHDSTQEAVRCLKDVVVDTVPVKFSIDARYDSDYKAQRALMTERVTNYDSLGNSLGYGISMAYTSLHTIDYVQSGTAKIKAFVGGFEVELLNAHGSASASGKDNSWDKLADVRGLPPTFFYEGIYYFAANGMPLNSPPTFDYITATFSPMPSVHPCTELWNAQFAGASLPTVYQVEKFHGSANIEATGFYVTDCDPQTNLVAGIECEVKVSASFAAPTGNGVWDMGTSFVFDHEVSIYFTWFWRGEKRRKTLISTIVNKPPPFPARQRMNPFVADTDSTPIYHLTFPEFQMGSETFDQLVGLRNHQGVSPCYAGHSVEDEAVSTLIGVAESVSTTRATGSGTGMIYTRTLAKGDLNNCVWLLERLGIANPLSSAPLETDPVLTRPYGYSDALYEALTNTEYRIHLLDGVEADWPSTLTTDPSATFTCKRV